MARATTLTITAQAGDATANWYLVLTPPPAPDSLTLDPVETANGSRGVVRIPLSAMTGHDQLLRLTSSNPAVASVPEFMTVPASTEGGVFFIETSPVTARTVITISVTGGGVTRSADLVVHPSLPPLTGFSVNPTSVPAGTTATGTVILGSPAPPGGVAVSLGSSLPGSVSVPATVTVLAGATSATFTATTFPGSGPTTAQLTATLGETTLFAALGVTQSPSTTLTAVTVNPASVTGGTSSTGTVTLSAPAPSGGVVVTLSDNSAAASVPGSVTVSAGATSKTFAVSTSAVSSQTAVTVSGSFGGVTRSATLTVNPAPLPAPSLLSPSHDARFQPGATVTFDWSDVTGVASYTIQIDDSNTFQAPFTVNQTVATSHYTATGLPTQRMWWRVRAIDSTGAPGAWSAVRQFELKN